MWLFSSSRYLVRIAQPVRQPVLGAVNSPTLKWRLSLISAIYSARGLSPICSGKPFLLDDIIDKTYQESTNHEKTHTLDVRLLW